MFKHLLVIKLSFCSFISYQLNFNDNLTDVNNLLNNFNNLPLTNKFQPFFIFYIKLIILTYIIRDLLASNLHLKNF